MSSSATRTEAVIIGGGPAGLAMSHHLTAAGVDHVIIERGRTAERWRSERWDSLRLLTPNWQTRLPGWRYGGSDPEGFMTMPEVVHYLSAYGRSFDAPIQELTSVERVTACDGGYEVQTTRNRYVTRSVVIATGATDTPAVPSWAGGLGPDVARVASPHYRNPGALADGGVLVVGASASGLQIADELASAGRDVVLAVGSHTRLPRTYRGLDIHWWLDSTGVLDTRYDEVQDIDAARRAPSLQLVGTLDRRSIDLGSVAARGVRIVGRGVDATAARVTFGTTLDDTMASADRRLHRLLDRFDSYATSVGLDPEIDPVDRPAPVRVPAPTLSLDLRAEGIGTVLWATGFRRRYPWLELPVLDQRDEIRHDGGVTELPGVYVMGLPFMRRRKSTFIDGFGLDAAELAPHLLGHLGRLVVAD